MTKLTRGCVVKMKAGTCIGYGNEQCISWVSEPLGEIGLFGHNEACKTYDVQEVISYPDNREAASLANSVIAVLTEVFSGKIENAEMYHHLYGLKEQAKLLKQAIGGEV